MKRKLLAMSLSLVVASSLVLSGCGSKNESVVTSTKVEKTVKDTEKATEVEKVVSSTEVEETEVEIETETEKAVESIESEESVNEAKESTSGKTKETTSTSGSSNSGSGTSGDTTETAHVHNWTPVTTIVHHDAVTHEEDQGSYITVVDQEAYDSEEPVMDFDCICITCYNNSSGTNVVRLHGQEEVDAHIDYHFNTFGGSCQYGWKSFQAGTQIIHYSALTHQEWQSNIVTVTDKSAYDEEVITGYVCSECGATK